MASQPIKSITEAIGDMIVDYARAQKTDPFHMSELNEYVQSQQVVAPDSPGRILRSLRSAGKLNYELISRSKSLYQFC